MSEPLVFEHMTDDEYRALPGISATMLKAAWRTCWAKAVYERDNPEAPSAAMRTGSALHALMAGETLPDDGQCSATTARGDQCSRAGRYADGDGALFCGTHRPEAAEELDAPIFTPSEVEAAEGMAAALRAEDSPAYSLLSAVQPDDREVVIQWNAQSKGHPDIPCKAKLDAVIRRPGSGLWVVDYKSCQSAEPRAWEYSAAKYGYHLQAAWYAWGVRMACRCSSPLFFFLPVESSPPYLVGSPMSYTTQTLKALLPKVIEPLLAKYRLGAKHWGYPAKWQDLAIPTWALEEKP